MSPRTESVGPEVAVIIPIHRQAQFLLDAVTSVLQQSMSPHVRTVLINDGCPWPETDSLCRFLARANPERLVYVKQANTGLSRARNRGIRLALSLWPTVRAIFPLDADNALAPMTLERLLGRLDASGADWVYVDQETMGARGGTIRRPSNFSVYRLLVSNFCDAGSLIHRRLFDDGFWFDSPDPAFPEDWHFFARAALSGYRGAHLADAGFLYRVLGGAMHDSQSGPPRLTAPYWPAAFSPRNGARVLLLEHEEMPRFAFIDPGTFAVTFGSHPALTPSRTMSLESFTALVADRSPAQDGGAPYVPPFTVVATPEVLDALVAARLWDGIAYAATGRVSVAQVVSVGIEQGNPAWRPGFGGGAAVSFVRTSGSEAVPSSAPHGIRVSLPGRHLEPVAHHRAIVDAVLAAVDGRPLESADAAIHGNDRAFADLVHAQGRRRFLLTPAETPTGVVVSADRLSEPGMPWDLLSRDGPIHLVVIGTEFEAGALPSRICSTALVSPGEGFAVELAGALYPCLATWLVDTPVSPADLGQACWMGQSFGFVTTAPDVLFDDPRLGIARTAATNLGGVVTTYATTNAPVEALLSAWGVPDAKLTRVPNNEPLGETAA